MAQNVRFVTKNDFDKKETHDLEESYYMRFKSIKATHFHENRK